MPAFTVIAGLAAGFIALAAFAPYVRAILRGETRPNRASWFIWLAVGIMLGSSYFASGAKHTLWVPVSYVVGPLIIAILSIKRGEGGWTRFDRACLAGATVSLLLWLLFREPRIALAINLFIDGLGALPTIKKAYLEPEKEDCLAWILWCMANTTNLLAVEKWTFSIAAYPIYMATVTTIIAPLLLWPRKKITN